LARHGDETVLDIFEASFDGKEYSEDTFDKKFFLSNVKEIVK
jgi:hypothetical protein